MPPPVTPSHRRFQAGSNSQRQNRPPGSSARKQDAPFASSQRQFAPTPRFIFSSSIGLTGNVPTNLSSPLATRATRTTQVPSDDIDVEDDDKDERGAARRRLPGAAARAGDDDENITDNTGEEMFLDLVEQAIPTKRRQPSSSPLGSPAAIRTRRPAAGAEPITVSSSPESDAVDADLPTDDELELVPMPLPPRLQQTYQTSQQAELERLEPQTPARKHTPGPRFRLDPASYVATQSQTQQAASTPTTASQRPAFVLPPPVESAIPSADMLPLLFSPQRRGQRYVPGGLAETVRDWVLEAGAQMQVSTPTKIQVCEVVQKGRSDGGVFLVRGWKVLEDDEQGPEIRGTEPERFMLIGADEFGVAEEIKHGSTIMVRRGWDIELGTVADDDNGEEEKQQHNWQVCWGPVRS